MVLHLGGLGGNFRLVNLATQIARQCRLPFISIWAFAVSTRRAARGGGDKDSATEYFNDNRIKLKLLEPPFRKPAIIQLASVQPPAPIQVPPNMMELNNADSRGIKRKAEDPRPTFQAPKRIKVEEQDHHSVTAG